MSELRRIALYVSLAAACCGSGVTAETPGEGSRRPNVVIFLADDMRPDSIAALGNPDAKTPHLDAIARHLVGHDEGPG